MPSLSERSMWVVAVIGAVATVTAPQAAMAAGQDATADQSPAMMAGLAGVADREAKDEKRIDEQAALLAAQAAELAKTKALLEQQQQQLEAMKVALVGTEARLTSAENEATRAAGVPGAGMPTVIADLSSGGGGGGDASGAAPSGPVGEAPPALPPATLALPQGINALTPKGTLVFDQGIEYQDTASNRIVFSGVEIVDTVLLGEFEANQTRDQSALTLSTLRYGLLNGLELDLTVPYAVRSDSVTLVQTAQTNLTDTTNIRGNGIGDVEGTLQYQFTKGSNGWPVLIGAMRVISDTGRGPFDVPFRADGVAEALPTGSGFWAIQPTLTFIYPLDPIVMFGSVAYQHSFGRAIDKAFGTGTSLVEIGQVQPGDAISASIGFAFSLNQHFSYSLGYKDNYFLPTTTVFRPTGNLPGGLKAESLSLQAGSFLLGGSYQLNRHVTLNLNFEFGVTPDAPNDTIIFRVPYTF
jgi:hypothetical protein